MQKITPFLWYSKEAEQAAAFLTKNGIPCTVEHNLPNWSPWPNAYSVVGIRGFAKTMQALDHSERTEIFAAERLIARRRAHARHVQRNTHGTLPCNCLQLFDAPVFPDLRQD